MRFVKLHGSGNDFLIVDEIDGAVIEDYRMLARDICDRHCGAGADGLVTVSTAEPGSDADFSCRIFNADGSEAEISGNGTRCAAAYLYYRGRWKDPQLRIDTRAGVKRLTLKQRDETRFTLEADMGRPRLKSSEIDLVNPVTDKLVAYPLNVGGDIFEVTITSMGNPHCTIFFEDLDEMDFRELGPYIENHPLFPERTNVEFVRVMDRKNIEVRFWERGVGETLSSGTGACAAAVASVLNGLVERGVMVHGTAGSLFVQWREDGVVVLTGPAELIYQGVWLKEAR